MKKFETGKRYFANTVYGKVELEIVKRTAKTVQVRDLDGTFASNDIVVRTKIKFDGDVEYIQPDRYSKSNKYRADNISVVTTDKKVVKNTAEIKAKTIKTMKSTSNEAPQIRHFFEDWQEVSLIEAEMFALETFKNYKCDLENKLILLKGRVKGVNLEALLISEDLIAA